MGSTKLPTAANADTTLLIVCCRTQTELEVEIKSLHISLEEAQSVAAEAGQKLEVSMAAEADAKSRLADLEDELGEILPSA